MNSRDLIKYSLKNRAKIILNDKYQYMLILVVLTWICKFVVIKCICKRICPFDSQYNAICMKYQSETRLKEDC